MKKSLIILLPFIIAFTYSEKPFQIDFEKEDWHQTLHLRNDKKWGEQNLTLVYDAMRGGKVLQVHFPKGSASPNVTKYNNAPVGGAEFLAQTGKYDSAFLTYHLKFSENFDFVKGGKLPGLFGGTANSGGSIPTGYDGFSTRMMWRQNGIGELYAYMPSSEQWGTTVGEGKFSFTPGKWYKVQQQLILNESNRNDGIIKIWINDSLVHVENNLSFRKTDSLKIEGIFFSTFFGGNDTTWAATQDCSIYFDDLSISKIKP